MSELLGITGAIGCGKTTFAKFLGDATEDHAHYETWQVVAEIATAFNKALKAELAYETTSSALDLTNQVLIWLPDAVSECLRCDVVWSQLAITKHDSLQRPKLYEKLFAYLRQVEQDQNVLDLTITDSNKETFRPLLQWLGNYLIVKISKTIWFDELIRRIELHNSTTSLVTIGGVRYPSDAEVIRVHNGKIVVIERAAAPNTTAPDTTEAERENIKPDIIVANDGSLEALRTVAENLTNDLMAGKPQKHYSASGVTA